LSEIEFLVKLRDGLQMAVDAISEYVEKKASVDTPWNPNKVKWIPYEGTKGPYEKLSSEMSEDAKKMLADLKEKGGKLMRDGFFYWVFSDMATVGRKKR